MPELPEVETVRRLMSRILLGKKVTKATFADDEIVLSKIPASAYVAAIEGKTVSAVGRRGKYWWIELDEKPWVFGHLGMAGWIREIPQANSQVEKEIRLREHGKAPLYDETGMPRFLKMLLTTETGEKIAFTDHRRFARLWLGSDPEVDKAICKLGPDSYLNPYSTAELSTILSKRKTAIKAILLDQKIFCGVGNWIADETLYASHIAPHRPGNSLKSKEIERLSEELFKILHLAVEAGADHDKFPKEWLFHARWGGGKGIDLIEGKEIIRQEIGGRTTAWVPSRQK